jgi:hypothetical protein
VKHEFCKVPVVYFFTSKARDEETTLIILLLQLCLLSFEEMPPLINNVLVWPSVDWPLVGYQVMRS